MADQNLSRRDMLKLTQLLPLGLLSQMIPARQPVSSEQADLPNILIILFDTLSAENMSLYGYPRETTPSIERAAAEGATVFHRHYAGGSYTPTGTASLLTGTYPWTHRALHVFSTIQKQLKNQNIFHSFADQYNTFAYSHNTFVNMLLNQLKADIHQLIERHKLCLYSWFYSDIALNQDNFKSLAQAEGILFSQNNQPASLLLSRIHRFLRLYIERRLNQRYAQRFPRGVPNSIYSHFTLEEAINGIKKQASTQPQPYLGYLHLMPPHYPYTARYDFVDKFVDDWTAISKPESVFSQKREQAFLDHQRRHYDEFIGYVDAEFGRLFKSLSDKGILEDTYLILTSDHGELFERGIWAHDTPTLYEPVLHIPLLVWRPGQSQRIDIQTPTSCVDVLPALLQATGQPIPAWCEGQALPGLGGPTNNQRSVLAVDSKENSQFTPLTQGSIALYQGPYKLTRYFGYEQSPDFYEFYNIEDDPDELNNLYSKRPSVTKAMKEELLERLSNSNQQLQR